MKCTIVVCEILVVGGAASAANFGPLSLPALTENIMGWMDGSAYAPLYPSSSPTLNGVPFVFQSDASGNNIFCNYSGLMGLWEGLRG